MISRLLDARKLQQFRKSIQVKTRVMPEIAEVASDDLYFAPPTLDLGYQPTFAFNGYVDQAHEEWAKCPLTAENILQHRIFGWLRRADALKLYEMAALCEGDVLELGTHRGLSAHIMANAIGAFETFGPKRSLLTVELDPQWAEQARATLAPEIARGLVTVQQGEAGAECRKVIERGKRFGFVFVDHSHYYNPMCEVCRLLPDIVLPGGFVLFHDFTDPRSSEAKEGMPEPDFGVLAACRDVLSQKAFAYHGAYGCSGLFRRSQ